MYNQFASDNNGKKKHSFDVDLSRSVKKRIPFMMGWNSNKVSHSIMIYATNNEQDEKTEESVVAIHARALTHTHTHVYTVMYTAIIGWHDIVRSMLVFATTMMMATIALVCSLFEFQFVVQINVMQRISNKDFVCN